MTPSKGLPVILIADDNLADRLLAIEAFRQARLHNPIHEVVDGEDLMDYLLRRGKYADKPLLADPVIILLDINMPKKNGLEALREIKSNPKLQSIPVIMLTTSSAEKDIVRSYDLGVNSFVTKPVDFPEFLEAIKQLGEYWLELVALPEGVGKP